LQTSLPRRLSAVVIRNQSGCRRGLHLEGPSSVRRAAGDRHQGRRSLAARLPPADHVPEPRPVPPNAEKHRDRESVPPAQPTLKPNERVVPGHQDGDTQKKDQHHSDSLAQRPTDGGTKPVGSMMTASAFPVGGASVTCPLRGESTNRRRRHPRSLNGIGPRARGTGVPTRDRAAGSPQGAGRVGRFTPPEVLRS
jgi:hypothetical protein